MLIYGNNKPFLLFGNFISFNLLFRHLQKRKINYSCPHKIADIKIFVIHVKTVH